MHLPTLPDPFLRAPAHHNDMPLWMRSIDLTCCVLALPVLSLSVLVMSLVVRFTSPGPLFFQQERVGWRGRRFKIFKFRTMTIPGNAVHQAHSKQLMKSNAPIVKLGARRDPRLLPGGWMLRASGMDQLPQIINVLRGEMSLVGPRPCIPGELEKICPRHARG
jgi:exopolysaccharide production protein ExoY